MISVGFCVGDKLLVSSRPMQAVPRVGDYVWDNFTKYRVLDVVHFTEDGDVEVSLEEVEP